MINMERKYKLFTVLNAIFLFIDIICSIIFITFSIFIGRTFLNTYNDFHMTVPNVTKIALRLTPYVFVFLILFLIIKERIKEKSIKLMINIIAFIIIVVSIISYSVTVSIPLSNLGAMNSRADDFEETLLKCSKAIETDPNDSAAYGQRAILYFLRQDYTKSWEDVHKAELLGYKFKSVFLEDLKESSNRKE